MHVGIGYQNEKNATLAGKLCAQSAMRQGGIDRPDLVLAFCSAALNADEFFQGLQSVLGTKTPIIGGSAIGVITNTELSYDGYPAGVAIIQCDALNCSIASAGEINIDEEMAGRRLATQLTRRSNDEMLLMFYDSIGIPSPPAMNASPPLLKGIESVLGEGVPIVGAGVIGNNEFGATRQFCGTYVDSQSVVGVLISGDCTPYSQIMHGCTLLDGVYHTITKIDGARVFEVDGKPIVEIIDALYGNQDWQSQIPLKRLSIGVNTGEKFANFNENQYVIRLISGVLPGGDGVMLFEPDLEPGMEIQFMLRDSAEIVDSVRKNAAEIMARIIADGRTPKFGFYIDCAGRAARFSNMAVEEAAEVMAVFERYQTPLFGFYSGVEVAPFLGKSRGLDWTGVLLVFAEG